jgi:hypothetical protein
MRIKLPWFYGICRYARLVRANKPGTLVEAVRPGVKPDKHNQRHRRQRGDELNAVNTFGCPGKYQVCEQKLESQFLHRTRLRKGTTSFETFGRIGSVAADLMLCPRIVRVLDLDQLKIFPATHADWMARLLSLNHQFLIQDD